MRKNYKYIPGVHTKHLNTFLVYDNLVKDDLANDRKTNLEFNFSFQAKMANIGKNGQKAVPIYSYISLVTMDVILRCAFSYDGDIQAQG